MSSAEDELVGPATTPVSPRPRHATHVRVRVGHLEPRGARGRLCPQGVCAARALCCRPLRAPPQPAGTLKRACRARRSIFSRWSSPATAAGRGAVSWRRTASCPCVAATRTRSPSTNGGMSLPGGATGRARSGRATAANVSPRHPSSKGCATSAPFAPPPGPRTRLSSRKEAASTPWAHTTPSRPTHPSPSSAWAPAQVVCQSKRCVACARSSVCLCMHVLPPCFTHTHTPARTRINARTSIAAPAQLPKPKP